MVFPRWSQSVNPVKAGTEMAQKRRLFHDSHPADAVAIGIHLQDRLNHVIDVTLRIHPAWNRQPQELVTGGAAEHNRSDLDRADAGVAVQFDSQGLSRELRARDVR